MESLNKFQSKSLSQLILEFSLPATIGMIVNYSYNIINRIFVGNKIGADALSAVAVLFPIFIIIYGISFMIGMGGQTNVSLRLGEKKYKEAEKILGNTLSLIIIASILISICILIFLEPLLDLTGSVGNIRPYSRDFMMVAVWGIMFQAVSGGMNNIIRAQGFPNIAMWTQIIGALFNILLDYIFLMVLNWGVKGAALATNISTFISMSWVLYFYFSKKSILKFRLKNFILNSKTVGIILAIGAPTLVTQVSGSVVTLLLNHILLRYGGSNAIATMSIINGIESFLFVPIIGLTIGLRSIIGFNYGALEFKRVRDSVKIGASVAIGIGLINVAIIQIFAGNLVKIFVPNNPDVILMGVPALRLYTMFVGFIGCEIITSTFFQSIGKPTISLILSLNRQLVLLLPLAFILPSFIGLKGIWLSGAFSDLGGSIVAFLLLIWGINKLKIKEKKHNQEKMTKQQLGLEASNS